MPQFYLRYVFYPMSITMPWAQSIQYEYFEDMDTLREKQQFLESDQRYKDFSFGDCCMKNGELSPHC